MTDITELAQEMRKRYTRTYTGSRKFHYGALSHIQRDRWLIVKD